MIQHRAQTMPIRDNAPPIHFSAQPRFIKIFRRRVKFVPFQRRYKIQDGVEDCDRLVENGEVGEGEHGLVAVLLNFAGPVKVAVDLVQIFPEIELGQVAFPVFGCEVAVPDCELDVRPGQVLFEFEDGGLRDAG